LRNSVANSTKFRLGIQYDYDIEEDKEIKELKLNEIKHYQNKNVA
jgi:hypothetical protein